jgi:hypothetical protein
MNPRPSTLTLSLLLIAAGEACARNDAATRSASSGDRAVTTARELDSSSAREQAVAGSLSQIPLAHACRATPGSAIEVAAEPPWRQHAEYAAWTDESGCLVRIDVLAERPGPEHCNWGDTRVLITGRPLGARYTSSADAQHYVRDPHGSYRVAALVRGFDARAKLPSGARDSGFRLGKVALWIDRAQPSAVYLVGPDSVERWPLGDVPVCQ